MYIDDNIHNVFLRRVKKASSIPAPRLPALKSLIVVSKGNGIPNASLNPYLQYPLAKLQIN